jgi:hypothetical protein
MSSNKTLVLSAGRGLSMDGIHKLKLTVPGSSETIKERIIRQFHGALSIVVGYRAAELISEWPEQNFIYNHRWFETGSATSAALGLRSMAEVGVVTIMPSDLIFSDEMAKMINKEVGNTIFLCNTENRSKASVSVQLRKGKIVGHYRGAKRDGRDLEAIGVVKLLNTESVQAVVNKCESDGSLYFVEAFIDSDLELKAIELPFDYSEINSVEDYYQLWKKTND